MAPASTHLSIRLTEPVVFLTGGTEHERARARRRRGARALGTPTVSRPGSRPGSRAGSPAQGLLNHLDEAFIPPGPQRARNRDSRQQSPAPGGGSRSASRQRGAEGTTTGSGTVEEAEAADEPPPAMLRGLLTLTLAKPSRIRDISMRLRGISRTDWPEGKVLSSWVVQSGQRCNCTSSNDLMFTFLFGHRYRTSTAGRDGGNNFDLH